MNFHENACKTLTIYQINQNKSIVYENKQKKIKCLINLEVDGIVTDKPKMLREIALNMGKVLD